MYLSYLLNFGDETAGGNWKEKVKDFNITNRHANFKSLNFNVTMSRMLLLLAMAP